MIRNGAILALFCVLLTLVALPSLDLPSSQTPQVGEGGTVRFSPTDAAMNSAIAEAWESLPLFLRHGLDHAGPGTFALVKVSFPTFPADFGNEIIWVSHVTRMDDGNYSGALANHPVNLGDWQAGQLVTFPESAIQDWSFEEGSGLTDGNYTTRVIDALPDGGGPRPHLSPDPIPADWR